MREPIATLLVIGVIILPCATACKTNSSQAENSPPGSQAVRPTSPPAPTPDPHELSRESILPVIRNQLTKTLQAFLPSSGWGRLYRPLVEAKVLTCSVDQIGTYYDCKPLASATNVRMGGNGSMTVSVGKKVPTVTGVSRTDSTSGVAQVVLRFQPAKGYEHFTNLGDAFVGCISRSGQGTQRTVAACDTQDERVTVHLRLYDDGWRIEKAD